MWSHAIQKNGWTQIEKWDEEHPLKMKSKPQMTPQDIIEEMNRQFDDAIIVTDVGQHQMFVIAVYGNDGKETAVDVRRTGNNGIWIPGCHRRPDRQSGQTGHCHFRETAVCR